MAFGKYPFSLYQIDKYVPVPECGCWLWTGTRAQGREYGSIKVRRNGVSFHFYAHRAHWIVANGPIPEGMFVCHKCDTPSCVNPDHLFLGTNADNMRDMVSKGRATKNIQRWRKK